MKNIPIPPKKKNVPTREKNCLILPIVKQSKGLLI